MYTLEENDDIINFFKKIKQYLLKREKLVATFSFQFDNQRFKPVT